MAVSREKLVKTAEKYVSRGKIEAAIKEYRKILEENPQDTNTLNRVGDLYARIQKFDEAVKLFSQIAEQYTQEGFFVKAIAIFKKIIKLDPTRLEVYERLAELYHKQGLINEAKTQYQVLADYYVKHDNAASAIGIYQSMVELEPDDATHHAKLAELYHKEQLIDKALEQYSIIAGMMLSHDQVEQAVQVYQRAFDVSPENLEFMEGAVARMKAAGQTGAAARLLAAAAAKNPEARRLADTDVDMAIPEGGGGGGGYEVEIGRDDTGEVALGDLEEESAGEDELAAAMSAAAAAVEESSAEEGEELDFGEGEDGDFVLEWDEGVSDSIVAPPTDMTEGPGIGFQRQGGDEEEGDEGADAFEDPSMDGLDLSDREETTEPGGDIESHGVTDGVFEAGGGPPSAVLHLEDLEREMGMAEEAADPLTSEFELELELDEEDFRDSLGGSGIELETLEGETAAEAIPPEEPEPEAEFSEEDYLSEAEVLAKYGLREKALERLDEVLERSPQSFDGHRLLLQLQLEEGEEEEVLRLAGEVARLAQEQGREKDWQEIRAGLVEEGYPLEEPPEAEPEKLEPPKEPPPRPKAKKKKDDRIGKLLESLLDEAPKPRKKVRRSSSDLDDLLKAATGSAGRKRPKSVSDIDLAALDPRKAAPAVEKTPPAPEAEEVEEALPVEEPVLEDVSPVESFLEEPPAEEVPAEGSPADEELELPEMDFELPSLEGEASEPDALELELEEAEEADEAEAEETLFEAISLDEDFEEEPEEEFAEEPAAAAEPQSVEEGMTIEQFLAQAEEPAGQQVSLGTGGDDSDIEDALSTLGPSAPLTPATTASESFPSLEDTGTSWLDQVPAEAPGAAEEGAQDLFAQEDDFFDLASELEEELDTPVEGDVKVPQEQSLEEIVDGFKKGVAEALSEEDFDTHFNLGIAYREMGLLDEAIGEFQLAAKDPGHLVHCCSMLGVCFLDKGLPELAVKWFTRGLAAPDISEPDTLALLYDLGEVYLKLGDTENARKTFVEVYGINTNYRDIVARLEELGQV